MSTSSPRLRAPSCARPLLALVLCSAILPSVGCVEHALLEKNRPGDYDIEPELPLPPAEAGAIWQGDTASGSFLFFDRKARGRGDLVTVYVVEDFSARGSAETSLGGSSSIDASLSSSIGIANLFQKAANWFLGIFGAASAPILPDGADVNALRSNTDNDFDGDGETSREGSFNAIVTCRVLKVLPGGIFHIRGRRSIIVNHEKQVLTVEGLVRREDIAINNTVASTALAEAQLAFDGMGVIDEKQRPSVVSRLMNWIYPF